MKNWLIVLALVLVAWGFGVFGRSKWQGSGVPPVTLPNNRPSVAPTQKSPPLVTTDPGLPVPRKSPALPNPGNYGVYLGEADTRFAARLEPMDASRTLEITRLPQVPGEAVAHHVAIVLWQPSLVPAGDVHLYELSDTPILDATGKINGVDVSTSCMWTDAAVESKMPGQLALVVSRLPASYRKETSYCLKLDHPKADSEYYPFRIAR